MPCLTVRGRLRPADGPSAEYVRGSRSTVHPRPSLYLVAQDVVLGINAHVNYDLALALSLVGVDPDRETKYADHCAVNDVLGRLVDDVRDRLASLLLGPTVSDRLRATLRDVERGPRRADD
jgi:hypothetical protein